MLGIEQRCDENSHCDIYRYMHTIYSCDIREHTCLAIQSLKREVKCDVLKRTAIRRCVRKKNIRFNINHERLKAKHRKALTIIHRPNYSSKNMSATVVWMKFTPLRVLSHRYIRCVMCMLYTLMPNMIRNKFQLPEIRAIWYAKLNFEWMLGNGSNATSYKSQPNRIYSLRLIFRIHICAHERTIATVALYKYIYMYIYKQRACSTWAGRMEESSAGYRFKLALY